MGTGIYYASVLLGLLSSPSQSVSNENLNEFLSGTFQVAAARVAEPNRCEDQDTTRDAGFPPEVCRTNARPFDEKVCVCTKKVPGGTPQKYYYDLPDENGRCKTNVPDHPAPEWTCGDGKLTIDGDGRNPYGFSEDEVLCKVANLRKYHDCSATGGPICPSNCKDNGCYEAVPQGPAYTKAGNPSQRCCKAGTWKKQCGDKDAGTAPPANPSQPAERKTIQD